MLVVAHLSAQTIDAEKKTVAAEKGLELSIYNHNEILPEQMTDEEV